MSSQLEEYRTRLREALGIINELKSRVSAAERAKTEPIAIVGLACRFPGGATGPAAFWELLETGGDGVREIPPERWPADAIVGAGSEVRWAALLDDIDGFDAPFFGISPPEATSLDPQHRMLLEVAWEALEDSGLRADRLQGSRAGVFLGICRNDYEHGIIRQGTGAVDAYSTTGNLLSTAAGRLSYWLGLQGPCLSIDTACSSSLVAAHLACQSLRQGESDLAFVGGVNAILSPITMTMMSRVGALSPDGRCKTFDARANGYVRGEGCGIVVLKRLSDARRDGDRIRALVLGSAVNQDGRSTGLTAPNVLSQQALLRQALESARVSPGDIGYVETHGTGTPLGDPIEIDALKAVMGEPRPEGEPCVLGAVKTNIGHLEGAAGVAGLVKAVLCLERAFIPKNLHQRALNPRIELDGTPFVIPRAGASWPSGAKPRRAGVSSFGISGTNAHVVLEEAPRGATAHSAKEASSYLLPLSAKTPEALAALAVSHADLLSREPGDSLRDITFAASVRRTFHEHRLVVVGSTRSEMSRALAEFGRGESPTGLVRGEASSEGGPRVAFVYPGQGSQWLGMGRQLLAEEPAFRSALEACDAAIREEAGFGVLAELAAEEGLSRLSEIDVVQPVLFAIQVALTAQWRAWGVEPDVVVGHSMGEVAAAHVAGMLSLRDAVAIICRRSRLLRRISGKGAMALVELPMAEAELALVGHEALLGVAVSNGPRSTVLSGDSRALEAVLAALQGKGVFCRRVKVDVASHSPQVDPLRDDLLRALGDLRPSAGRVAMRSTVTGKPIAGPELDARYWAANLREPVRFSQVTQALVGEGYGLFVEIGPHPILLPSIDENLKETKARGAAMASMRRQADERQSLLEALGTLHVYGHGVDFGKLHPEGGRHAELPTYPWQHGRYWREDAGGPEPARDPLDACVYEVQWQRQDRAPGAGPAKRAEGAWLVLADRGGVGETLSGLLHARGDRCILVEAGSGYEVIRDARVRMDPTNADDYRKLFADFFGRGLRCRGVVHLFGLDAAPWEETTEETLGRDVRRGALSALFLSQALLERGFRDVPRVHWVTRGAQAAGNTGSLSAPAQAIAWGFVRSLGMEHPELESARIDLDPRGDAAEAGLLLDEVEATDGEDQTALRLEGRYVARLVRSRFDAVPARAFELRADATYLVTDGSGGPGLSFAAFLVERGARHVALVASSSPSEDASETIAALERAGAEVLVFSGDLSRGAEVDRLLLEIEQRLPPLRGIVHAAGRFDDHTVMELSATHFDPVLGPKVMGAWHLHHATRERPLDFFVVCSSMASMLGSPARANHAAADAFLDAMAHARAARGLSGISVQWGPFKEAADVEGTLGTRSAERGLESLTPAEMMRALGQILERPRPLVGIVHLDVRRLEQFYPQLAGQPYLSRLERAVSGPSRRQSFRSTLEGAAPGEHAGLLGAHLREQLGRALKMEPSSIDPRMPFQKLGVDSLMSLEVRNRLEASLGQRLPATLLFTYSNLDALTASLLSELGLATAPVPEAPAAPAPGEADMAAKELADLGGAELLALLDEELALTRKGGKP